MISEEIQFYKNRPGAQNEAGNFFFWKNDVNTLYGTNYKKIVAVVLIIDYLQKPI